MGSFQEKYNDPKHLSHFKDLKCDFKQFNTENFKADMEQTPFYTASVFDDIKTYISPFLIG